MRELFLTAGLVLFCCVFFLTAEAEEKKPNKLVFSRINGSIAQFQASKVITRLYEKLGIKATYKELPGKRALKFSNEGKTNGEVFRIKEAGKKLTNLVRIPTKLMNLRGFAYTLGDQPIDTFDQLKSLRIGIQRGVLWAENGTQGLKVERHDDNLKLLEKLLAGGIDVTVAAEFSFEEEIKGNGTKAKILRGKPLSIHAVYHFIHKDYAYLIEDLDRELKKMKKAGDVEKITGIIW